MHSTLLQTTYSITKKNLLKTFKANSSFKGSRYEVKLPFRPHIDFILDNYILAEKILTFLQEHLTEDSNSLFEYDKTTNDYMSMGKIEKLLLNENIEPETIHYLPQRAVVKSERETTKVQTVFDASWKQPDKPSLNDILYARPCLLPKWYEILLCF